MQYQHKFERCDNGLSFCSVDTGSAFKHSIISISFVQPLLGDVASRAMLPGILKRTTKKYPSIVKMSRKLASLYGASIGASITKNGENQVITLTASAPDDRFSLNEQSISDEVTDLLLDVIFEPNLVDGNFRDEDIELERRLMLERKESELNDKRSYAYKRLIENMCRTEIYSIDPKGTVEEIKSVNAGSLTEAWNSLIRTSLIQVTIVGSSDAESIKARFLKRFSGFDRSRIYEPHTEFVYQADEMQNIRESVAAKQGKLVIGMRAGMTYSEENLYSITVMNDLFGGGVYSKLFRNVREKMSLCYYCSSALRRDKGIIVVQSGIENENCEKAVDAILAQLQDMKDGKFTDEDLEASKKGLVSGALSVYDTPEDLLSWYALQRLDTEIVSPREYADEIEKITRESVMVSAYFVSVDTVYMLEGTDSEDL